ncbi:MAG: UDP-N-acetylmuramoyl-L-alanine--D-glutamate ligase [Prevotellaceae bacterium]|jgi:UDP-N-acetylmuramoylalanine--D-glutamate ligase|nr:UDP-N-acetylmuramoyl-L-alanine--D-glutamate ligase [Prevotellaceae bacterium]
MKIAILGAGESGVGAAVLAQQQGFEVWVSDLSEIKPQYRAVLDKYKIEYEAGQHTEERILSAAEVIKSPGIPDKAPIIKALKTQGTPIISEIEFAARYTNAKMICITGSNGKTTTTMLTYYILKNAGLNVGLAGNVGQSLALQVAESNFDYFVIELSSLQLDNMYRFKADIAILLNITPDHLDRYNYEFQNYVDAKFRILQNQDKDCAFIYWAGDPVVSEELRKKNEELPMQVFPFNINKEKNLSAYVENNLLTIKTMNDTLTMPVEELALTGTHNIYNSMAAATAASVLNIKKDVIRHSLSTFEGVEHRLEYVATVRGVRFINDSKATNVNSCWYALESMTEPTVLILGGTDKGNDYSEIEELVAEKVRAIVCMGADNRKILDCFTGKVPAIFDTHSVQDAVETAYRFADKGDTVLLSPCCASFDLFENYEDRGRKFKACVKNL